LAKIFGPNLATLSKKKLRRRGHGPTRQVLESGRGGAVGLDVGKQLSVRRTADVVRLGVKK